MFAEESKLEAGEITLLTVCRSQIALKLKEKAERFHEVADIVELMVVETGITGSLIKAFQKGEVHSCKKTLLEDLGRVLSDDREYFKPFNEIAFDQKEMRMPQVKADFPILDIGDRSKIGEYVPYKAELAQAISDVLMRAIGDDEYTGLTIEAIARKCKLTLESFLELLSGTPNCKRRKFIDLDILKDIEEGLGLEVGAITKSEVFELELCAKNMGRSKFYNYVFKISSVMEVKIKVHKGGSTINSIIFDEKSTQEFLTEISAYLKRKGL